MNKHIFVTVYKSSFYGKINYECYDWIEGRGVLTYSCLSIITSAVTFSLSPTYLSANDSADDDILAGVERDGEDLVPEEVDPRAVPVGKVQGGDPLHQLPIVSLEPRGGAVEQEGLVGQRVRGQGGVVAVEVLLHAVGDHQVGGLGDAQGEEVFTGDLNTKWVWVTTFQESNYIQG